MKQLLILILCLHSSLFLTAQKNLLLNVCSIGDTIYRLPTQFYCVDINKTVTTNFGECERREYRYFPKRNDSTGFNLIPFDVTLIIGDVQLVATKIYLFKIYPDTLANNLTLFKSDLKLLESYLNEQLKVPRIKVNEYMAGGISVNGTKWWTDSLNYILKYYTTKKKKKKTYTINVIIY
jgi:hypothetical protein